MTASVDSRSVRSACSEDDMSDIDLPPLEISNVGAMTADEKESKSSTKSRSMNGGTILSSLPPSVSRNCFLLLLVVVGFVALISAWQEAMSQASGGTSHGKSRKTAVFDVNGPPNLEDLQDEKRKKASTSRNMKIKKRKDHFSHAKRPKEKPEPIPVIHYDDDDDVPSGLGGLTTILHASDTLECRQSVINFVINATDAKDECEGLKKAFDTTCNSDSSEEILKGKEKHETTAVGDAVAPAPAAEESNQKRRRRLLESSSPSMIYQYARIGVYKTFRWISRTLRHLYAERQDVNFFAEDEVGGQTAWVEAKYQVQTNLDLELRQDFVNRQRQLQREENQLSRNMISQDTNEKDGKAEDDGEAEVKNDNKSSDEITPDEDGTEDANETKKEGEKSEDQKEEEDEEETPNNGGKEGGDSDIETEKEELTENDRENLNSDEDEREEEREDEDDENADDGESETDTHKANTKHHTMQSLTLPTSAQHISDQMLGETLLLQKEDTIEDTIINAMQAATNHTNTTLSEAAVDAVVSAKMVQDTTNVIFSTVLNDPTSIEARTCCASILNVFHENCDTPDQEMVSDQNLFWIVFIIAICGMVKSMVRFYRIKWLPEAAGCILVGVVCGAIMSFVPHYDISFDENWFLRIMVPPIVFEAALSIDKKSFHRHIVPIMIYAVAGTLLATGITAFVLHKGTAALGRFCETIPYVESLTFGALISSIDPIAVLSVLSSMGMTDTDTIYVIIFGESLLNDGVAIVLFHTLVHFLDESLVIDTEAVTIGAIHFFVVAFGSLFIGIASGFACTGYFWLMQGCQTPLVEVLLFFCWAFIPYYICDGIHWSGIVAVVATGVVMDLFVVGQKHHSASELPPGPESEYGEVAVFKRAHRRSVFNKDGHLSDIARTHVHFVCELLAAMMETAIFAYLGVFLFGYRYHWNLWHTLVAIFACCLGRAIMIPCLSFVANTIARIQNLSTQKCRSRNLRGTSANSPSKQTGVVVDSNMQLILWIAGLRGAMSFALVENIPLYDAVTGEGSRLKPELKAMTSATIVFTVFVLGGHTYYALEKLGMAPAQSDPEKEALLKRKQSVGNIVEPLADSIRQRSVQSRDD